MARQIRTSRPPGNCPQPEHKQPSSENKGPIRYIVTVHGIGQQRKNETVLEPIFRFAKARREGADIANPLTLGQLTGLSENKECPWIAFDGIPNHPPHVASGIGLKLQKELFFGRPEESSQSGENLRFVDLHWADVLDDRFDDVGVPLEKWAPALVKRLEVQSAPSWAVQVMKNMKQALLPINALLRLRLSGLSKLIFDRFLGDVQLYGECGTIRGEAVRRFHDVMAKVHAAHEAHEKQHHKGPEREARYTIIAHSLGSIMSLDALLYAHAPQDERCEAASGKVENRFRRGYAKDFARPAPGVAGGAQYTGVGGEKKGEGRVSDEKVAPNVEWIKNVDALVTIGSPIDKFIVMWPLNYEYLLDDQWMSQDMKEFRSEKKIKHFNYCDEQDPVGHELDEAYLRKAVKTVFGDKPAEDRVFNRYVLPGVAHLKYWTDDDLFHRILDTAVDQRDLDDSDTHRLHWFNSSVFLAILLCCYVFFPFIGWLACTIAASWWWFAGSFRASIIALAVLIALGLLTLSFMNIMIKWRRLMIVKRSRFGAAVDKDYWGRRLLGWAVRTTVFISPIVWGALLWTVRGGAIAQFDPQLKPIVDQLGSWSTLSPQLSDVRNTFTIAIVTGLMISVAILYLFVSARSRLKISA